MWEKVAEALNNCSSPAFNVDKRSVRDHVGILVNRYKKKLRAEEKATGITPDEPTELDNLLEEIIALEETADAELQEITAEKRGKIESDRAKAEDIRMKAMEKVSATKKRESVEMEVNKSKRQRRSGSDAMVYLSQRAEINYELKQEELKLKKEQQDFEKKRMEATSNQQLQLQQQHTEMLKLMQQQQQQQQQSQQQMMNSQMLLMQQQQQQTKALMGILEKMLNK